MWTLVIWTIVAAGAQDWRPIATNLESEEACKKASYKITQRPDSTLRVPFRCIGPQG